MLASSVIAATRLGDLRAKALVDLLHRGFSVLDRVVQDAGRDDRFAMPGVMEQRAHFEGVQDEGRIVGFAPLSSVLLSGEDEGGARSGKMLEEAWGKLLLLHRVIM
jgi:hypothetical protein